MVGYVTANRQELKVKDLTVYRAFYCGVCQDIKKAYGQAARMTLSYEMTFLAMLLSSVYDTRPEARRLKCLLHPASRQACARNKFTEYAADMCLILSYHNLMDDWEDERSKKSLAFASVLRGSYKKAAAKHPRQAMTVIRCIRETRKTEAAGDNALDSAAGHTGRMLAEIFRYYEDDALNKDLTRLGFYLGKFIYLMDAYDDLEKDIESGSYNPFAGIAGNEGFEDSAREVLTMMASEAAAALERLPAIDYIDILRNVLYSGVWIKYSLKHRKRKQK